MIQTVSQWDFQDAFKKLRPNQFTYEALNALYDYFEAYEDDTGQPVELDVIAFSVEYTEYADLKDFQGTYDAEEFQSMENIEDNTTVIPLGDNPETDGFIIQDF